MGWRNGSAAGFRRSVVVHALDQEGSFHIAEAAGCRRDFMAERAIALGLDGG